MPRIAIIVPTVNRPHLLAPLLQSIRAATATAHHVYFVGERDDEATQEAMSALTGKYSMTFGHHGSYTAAANFGVRHTSEPYFLIANDDVIFHPGWDEAALTAMQDPVRAVGINQGNGRTDCFFLVDRRYLAEQSGTFDEPGVFYHSGYLSQYVDTEFVELARHRGVWADATGALIEHRHWTLGKAGLDVNYRKAVASDEHDRALYFERRRQWAA